jgi:N-acetylmuramoyl-L-alanine amidase
MPNVYLSPSPAEYQSFVTGGNEEYYMNLVADAMIPYLKATGIEFDRNNPEDTVQQIIKQSNSKYRDLHLILNMESGVGNLAGKARGEGAVYYTGSPGGKEAADIFADNLQTIYPIPELVTVTSDRLNPELRDVDAESLMVILGYRDNVKDATWVINNIDTIGRNLAMSLAEYLKVPFVEKASFSSVPKFQHRI